MAIESERQALDACTKRDDCKAELHLSSCPRHGMTKASTGGVLSRTLFGFPRRRR